MAATVNNNCQTMFFWAFMLELFFNPLIFGTTLNIEELKNINYGLEIINKPVIKGQSNLPHSVYLHSRFGQEYECSYKDQVVADKRKEEKEKDAMDVGIPQLLQPMESEPCLKKTIHWWTYEFCYAKHVIQYHIEGDVIHTPILQLGVYESQFDWNNDTAQKNYMKEHRLTRYHTQHYTNGALCDVTQRPRSTEVRFECEEGSGDYIHRVDEPHTCSYILTVRTMRICHHPYLKPRTQTHALTITCHPILSPDDYDTYTAAIQYNEKKKQDREFQLNYLKEKMKEKYSSKNNVEKSPREEGVENTNSDTDKMGTVAADDTMQEFDKGLDEAVPAKDQEALSSMKDNIESSVKSQFKDIIKEASEEVGVPESEMDADEAMETLGKTLSTLMKRLDDKQKEVKDTDEHLAEEKEKTEDTEGSDDRVQIRITKLPSTVDTQSTTDGADANSDDVNDQYNTHELSKHQQDKIRKSYTQQNDVDGKVKGATDGEEKIQIEIIGAAYYDKRRPDVHILSDADSKTIRKVLSAIMGDTSEVDNEITRQTTQEAAYKYNWKDRISQLSSQTESDSDKR